MERKRWGFWFLGNQHPGKFPPGKFPPSKLPPPALGNSPNSENSPPGTFPPISLIVWAGGERGRFTRENLACTIITNKTFNEKMLLNLSWSLAVPSIT